MKLQIGQGKESSEEGHKSRYNVTESPTNFEEILSFKSRLNSVAALRTGYRTRLTNSFLIPWDLNHVAYIVVIVVIGYHSQLPEASLATLLSYCTLGLINVENPPARRQKLRLVSIEALLATQLEIDKYYLRLPKICTRQLARRRTPIINGNFTKSLARSILIVGSITWWIRFRIWCKPR